MSTVSSTVSLDQSVVAPPVRSSAAGSRLPARLTAVVGLVALIGGTVSVLALHVVSPTSSIDAFRRTISEYAYSSLAWVFNTGVIAVAAGSLALVVSLWLSKLMRPMSLGSFAVLAWSVGLTALVIFPKHNWAVGPSSSGTVHRIASLIAFASIPIAALAIGRRRTGPLRVPGRVALGFGIVAGGWLVALLGGFILGPMTRTPWWQVFPLGLMERGMAFSAVLALSGIGWLAVRAARQTGPTSGPAVDTSRR